MLGYMDFADWCDTKIGAESDKYRIIELGTDYYNTHDVLDLDYALKDICLEKKIKQILVPTDCMTESGSIDERGLQSSCMDGIIFAFEDGMIEFNFGSFRTSEKELEDFPETDTNLDDYCVKKCYRTLEHYIELNYKNNEIMECGLLHLEDLVSCDIWDTAMFGLGMYFKLSGGNMLCLWSGECNTIIEQRIIKKRNK